MTVAHPGSKGCWVLRREIPLEGPGATGEERALLRHLSRPPLENVLVFDVESTGLSVEGGDLAVVVGVLRRDRLGETLVVEQAVLASPEGEPALLRWWNAQVRTSKAVLSYNGQRFDARLLAARLRACSLPNALADVAHWDLLRHFRQFPPEGVSRLKLTVLEREVLDFHRTGDPPGDEVARLLQGWMSGKVRPLPESVLLHNRLDLLSLLVLFEREARPAMEDATPQAQQRSIATLQARPLPDVGPPTAHTPSEAPRWRVDRPEEPCWTSDVREAHASRIREALQEGKSELATALLHTWIEAEPTYGRPHAWLADVLESSANDLPGASLHAKRALELHPWDELLARRVRRLEARMNRSRPGRQG